MVESGYVELFRKAYKKLKSCVFFDKTQLILRDKIVAYEASSMFDDSFQKLINCFLKGEWEDIIDSISYSSFPKKIFQPNEKDGGIVSNWHTKATNITEFQYFIDMDVEGYILGIVWLLLAGTKIDNGIYEHSYGNRMRKNLLSDGGSVTYSPYLFEPYFQQYESWRDTALNCAKKSLNVNQDVLILMLDFKRFFYQVGISRKELFDCVRKSVPDYESFSKEHKSAIINSTDFVWSVIEKYSDELNSACPDLVGNRKILPIGFHPSNVLANCALKLFDDTLINGLNPIYYGRYVDDIIIVEKIEKNSNIYKLAKEGNLTADNVIEYYLTNCSAWERNFCSCSSNKSNGLLLSQEAKAPANADAENEYIVNPKFNYFSNSKIIVQKNKVKIFYFNSAQSDAMLSCFKEHLIKNKSEFRFLPEDEAVFQNDNYTEIYMLDEKEGPNKLRGVENITVDKFMLSKYLGKYTRVSGLINDKMENQFDSDIEKIFTCQVIIENYTVWEKVLEILVNNNKYDVYLKFVNMVVNSINNIKSSEYGNMLEHTKNTLYKVLSSCIFRTLSLSWGKKIVELQDRISEKITEEQSDLLKYILEKNHIIEMRKYYCKTRMCDKYAIPVLIDGFVQNEELLSDNIVLNLSDFESIKKFDYDYSFFNSASNDNQYIFYPYLITMNDLSIINILKMLKDSNNSLDEANIAEIKKLYIKLNYQSVSDNNEINSVLLAKEIDLNKKSITAIKVKNKEINSIKIAVANTLLYRKDFENVLKDCPNRSYARYKQLVKIVNEAIRLNADMLVLPENYLPFEWLPILARTCAKNQLAVVTGIEHLKLNCTVTNLTAVILPFTEDTYKFSYIHFHKKVHYAPHEKEAIESFRCSIDIGNRYELYNWNNFWFSVYCCYELSSITDRSLFQSYIDALVVVEWNKDTNYYSNILESLSRDLHCFCIQVNTSEYGDSRITRPSKTETLDIIKVKGGKNSAVLIDNVDVNGLRDFQLKGNALQAKSPDKNLYKHTPPDLNFDIIKMKQNGTLWDYICSIAFNDENIE